MLWFMYWQNDGWLLEKSGVPKKAIPSLGILGIVSQNSALSMGMKVQWGIKSDFSLKGFTI